MNLYRPDYGYRNCKNVKIPNNSNDGLFHYSIKDEKYELLFSLQDLIELKKTPSMFNARHKVNHIVLSPLKERVMFMHRWINNGKKEDRLYVYDFCTKELSLVSDFGMVSHCYWYGEDKIVGYMNGPERKPGYYLINLSTGIIERMSDLIQSFGDGHPSICGDEMIFDTYPNKKTGLKSLYLFNIKTDVLILLGQFKEPFYFCGESRCDLHPRFITPDLLSIDSTHTKKRSFYFIKIR